MMAQRRLSIGLKRGQVYDLHWVASEGEPVTVGTGRDPLRASRGILIAVPLAILLWAITLGVIGLMVHG